ncbi:hypothetical protein, partial [Oceanospirillum sanctuarii]|uniref:hypothetical protein n=1 Tax=Oceanospirillum sanctuarii TaxID=1434821 RepID=UPI00159466C3
SNLYAGSFALSGSRYDGVTTESLNGNAEGQFAGSNADGLFGYYQLAGSTSQIEGVYAFGDRQLDDYLAEMTALSGVNGYVLNNRTANPLSAYSLYQNGTELSALVDLLTGEQWVAASTGVANTAQLGDATVTWGSWNSWRQINDQSLIEQSTPIQYIHTNQLTAATVPVSLQGVYHFNSVSGQAYDESGANGGIQAGNLTIDFTQQQASLGLSGFLRSETDKWSVSGSDTLNNLYTGSFALSGSRYDGVTTESLNGNAEGQFAGSNVDGLFGYYQLAGSTSQIEGVYAFGDRQLEDYLAGMTALNGIQGYILNNGNSVNPLSNYALYQNGNALSALVNASTGEQWVAASTGVANTAQQGDATVTWGSWNAWRQINDQSLIEQST